MNLTVLGAGAWGTALAVSVAPRHATLLWARDAAQAAQMRATRANAVYLPGVSLPGSLQIDADIDAALVHSREGLVIIATPMAALGEMLQRVGTRTAGVLWLCKGFEQRSGLLGHELAHAVDRTMRVGVLSGPSFAIEVARGQPTALVAASTDASLCEEAVEALHSDSLRIYTSDDPIGVEVGGAVKNVLAIAVGMADAMRATGIADGLAGRDGEPMGLGLNARAALITRGLAEMTRLGVALGARAETFMGLSGLGDLVLTATGDLSRNRTVGRLLAQGLPLARILTELGHVAEGVSSAPMVLRRAQALGVEMPITQAVVAVLEGATTPARALEQLMGRGARPGELMRMRAMLQRRGFLRVAAIGAAALSQSSRAQAWPARPIKLVVPFPPGSSPDFIARLIAEPLGRALGQVVIVDNKPGAGGNVGTGVVAKSAADGHTFLFTIQGPLVTAPLLSKHLGYDPLRELAPVTLVATSPNVLVVDPRLGAETLADFVRIAKDKKGQLNYGSVGNGSASHLAMEWFKTRAGLDIVHVPYQGFPQVVNAMLAGQVQAGFMVPGIAIGQIRAGKLKALGVTTLGRSGSLPEYPTLAEQGYAGFEAISWQAVLAPAGTPKAIVERVAAELIRIIKSDDVRAKMLNQYFSAAGTAPEALAGLMKTERERWAQVIEAAGVQPE